MPGDIRLPGSFVIPARELTWRFSRSSGPGGQGVNTTDSRVELSLNVARTASLPEDLRDRALARLGPRLVNGVLTVTASAQRSQLQNREDAARRLAEILSVAIAPPPKRRRRTRPSKRSAERRLAGKRKRSETKRLRRRTDLDA